MSNLNVSSISSPLGKLIAGFTDHGLALLTFSTFGDLKRPQGIKQVQLEKKRTADHEKLEGELNDYFAGELTKFSIPLDLHGTDFQKKVWNALLEVPFGVTRSYKDQAKTLGDVKAIRAVATANGANPVAIIVPCHRIIGSNQSLTGYAGGLERKQFLLELESSQGRLF